MAPKFRNSEAAAFLVPSYLVFGFVLKLFAVLHVMLLEYIPYIILLLALFTVAGGIRLTGRLVGSRVVNFGNAPSFMVRAIAEEQKVATPSFFPLHGPVLRDTHAAVLPGELFVLHITQRKGDESEIRHHAECGGESHG